MLEISKLSKKFGSRVIFNDLSFSFMGHRIYGLHAPNGTGKTVLLRLLAGLMLPTSGLIRYADRKYTPKVLHKDIDYPPSLGMLLEEPKFILSETGKNNLMYLIGISGRGTERDVEESMIKLGLDPNLKTPYKKYSLGMKQKLGIAAAVMESPELILLDEPTNALDEEALENLKTILIEQRNRGALVIVASHNKEFLKNISDSFVTIREGRLHEE